MAPLIAIALKAGLPSIASILQRKLGDAGGTLANDVLQRKLGDAGGTLANDVLNTIASRAGIGVDELEKAAEENPGKVIDAMRKVEPMTPELIALYAKGLEQQFTLLQAEMAEGGWKAAWRPAGMWFVLFLWFYQIVGLHVANAIWRIALPPAPWEHLLAFTGLYMGLYMGGHTLKDMVAKWAGAGK